MEEVKINTSKTLTLTLPSDPASNIVSVSLYHEFGDKVSGPTNATRTGTGVYTITYGQQASGIYVLNSAGKHRADFTYTVSGTEYTQSQYINVYTPYITSNEFFENHPELEDDFASNFEYFAKRARNAIETFCGQGFQFYPNKTIVVDGNGYESMRLPLPVTKITSVVQDKGEDSETTLDNVEKVRQPFNFDTTYQVRFNKTIDEVDVYNTGVFNRYSEYTINGDFGWRFVPENIKQASDLIIADLMNNDSEYRMHGISRVDMDAVAFEMRDSFFDSTGNIEADILLMDYTLFVMDYVV